MNLRGMSRCPVVYCAHGWAFDRETFSLSRSVAMWLERALAPLCHAIVCISSHELRLARSAGIATHRLVLINNGVPRDAPAAPPIASAPPRPIPPTPPAGTEPSAMARTVAEWPAGKRRVLFVGRFDRQKGVDILVDALADLQDSAFAWLAGDSVLGDIAALRLPDNARMTGWLTAPELSAYYESADMLVAPSRWEGFGLIAAEAMRAGLPVIATRVGGLAEIVEHGVTGILIEPADRQALIEAIRSTPADRLKAMGTAGRERFLSHYTLDRVHAQLNALYQRLLAQLSTFAPATATEIAAGGATKVQPEGTPHA
jgi:glycosyltransferase involved in cell wall biosynthesis